MRQQFGRTIATFQAIKHHCANMLVGAESAIAAVWDASRAAAEDSSEDEAQFRLAAASAAALAFPAYARNAELNIQVHGGIGFTWEHDAHLHLRRALVTTALFGGDAPAGDVFDRTAAGAARENSLDLPPEAEELLKPVAGQYNFYGQLALEELGGKASPPATAWNRRSSRARCEPLRAVRKHHRGAGRAGGISFYLASLPKWGRGRTHWPHQVSPPKRSASYA